MHRIQLANEEFEGLNNAYLLDGDGPTVLLDTGVGTEEGRAQLEGGLADHDVALADVDAVVLTHWHHDHAGLAGEVQAASGATVYVHEADAPVVARAPGAWADMEALVERRFAAWGVPDAERETLLAVFAAAGEELGEPPTVEPLRDGDEIPAGGDTLRLVHAPGHTAGLAAFEIVGTDEAFVGDAVLPQYTPNVGGADLRVEHPLSTYLDTLARLDERNYARVHPGHRTPIDDPAARIRTIVEHHRERTRRVVEALDALGPSTPWEVSSRLFGDLEGIHILHGPGESFAHLDHLEARGDVERDGVRFRLTVAPEDVVAE